MKVSISVLVFFVLMIMAIRAESQTTAMDFTRDDCAGNPYQLFTELDAGEVVILEFVMLNCAPCIVGTKALESIIKPYDNTHPGRISIYSFGFLDSYTCEQISAWKTDNSFDHPVFSEGEEQVDYYGGMGMPTIVVVGTNEHKVFFKSIGYLPSMDDEIKAALDSALLYNPSGYVESIPRDLFSIYPTVFTNTLHVQADQQLVGTEIVIYDSFGREVIKRTVPAGGVIHLSADQLAAGIYFARIRGNNGNSNAIRLIKS